MIGVAELIIILAIAIVIGLVVRSALWGEKRPPGSKPAEIDYDALADPELQEEILRDRKINAIKRYRELTGAGLKDAKDAVEWAMDTGLENLAEKKRRAGASFSDAGIRDLLEAGRRDEAVELYARFAGVDEYTAQDAVDDIERAMRLEADSAPAADLSGVRDLLRAGNKIGAIKAYQDITGAGLKDAKDAVDGMEDGA